MRITKLNDLVENGVVIKGKWILAPNHELQYKAEGLDEEVKFSGSLIAAEPGALVVSVTERQTDQTIVTKIVKIAGSWKVDPANQITFEVERERGANDALTFRGAWKVGRSHEIIYTYKRTNLKTKTRENQELVFKGYWDISEKNRLTYFVGGDADNAFRFRGTFQSRSILAKKGEIRYQIGAEVSGRSKTRTVVLFGKWIVSRDFSLSFEMAYENGAKKAIGFGGTYTLGGGSIITVELKTKKGEPLAVGVLLTKDIFGRDGQAFLRLQRSLAESRVEAGVRVAW